MGVTFGAYGKNDASGFTKFTQSEDTKEIHLAPDGSDTTGTGTEQAPFKTIKKGESMVRSGYPDWLLMIKGGVWNDEAFSYIGKKGRSATELRLISSYGSGARPLVNVPVSASTAIGAIGGDARNDYLAVKGIEFYAHTRDPNSPKFDLATVGQELTGMRFLNPTTMQLVEDCKFSYFTGLIFEGVDAPLGTVNFRRNVVVGNYSTHSHAQGVYTYKVQTPIFHENVMDHNGWNEQVEGAGRTIYNHNFYFQSASFPADVRGNINARPSSVGVQARSGAEIVNNLFLACSIVGFTAGDGAPPFSGCFDKNVVLHSLLTAWGPQIHHMSPGAKMRDNIVAHSQVPMPFGYKVGEGNDATSTDVVVKNNKLYKAQTTAPLVIATGCTTIESGNDFDMDPAKYVDLERTIMRYNQEKLGREPTMEDFLAEAAKQSQDNWRPEYTARAVNDWMEEGYTKR